MFLLANGENKKKYGYLPTIKLHQWHYITTAKTTNRETKNSHYRKIIEVNT